MIKLTTLLEQSWYSADELHNSAAIEKVLDELGYSVDANQYESRYRKQIATGILCFDFDRERYSNGATDNTFRFEFYFEPYVQVKSRLFGLYKKQYSAPGVRLNADSIDFGTGLFRLSAEQLNAQISRLKRLLEAGEARIEGLQDELQYSEIDRDQYVPSEFIKKI